MKIALIGYGKMGQIIEKIAINGGHSIAGRITSGNWDARELEQADVCIDFTHPESVLDNVRRIAKLKKNIVIGTTGWNANLELVKSLAEEYQIGILYSPNFSVGVNLLLEILSYASTLFDAFDEYDIAGVEYHHNKKQDSPSGTALQIAKTIEDNMERIQHVPFSSVRCGNIPGTHTVLFDSHCDTISIKHEARNREGFAKGAILAAEWLIGKKGFYTFTNCMQEIIKKRSL